MEPHATGSEPDRTRGSFRELGKLGFITVSDGLVVLNDLPDDKVEPLLGKVRVKDGARIWLDEIIERDGVDAATALFSESTGRVIVSIPREDDVRFLGLCEARNYPVLRIGVTDLGGDDAKLDVQGLFEVSVAEIRQRSNETLPQYFG